MIILISQMRLLKKGQSLDWFTQGLNFTKQDPTSFVFLRVILSPWANPHAGLP